MSGLFSTFCFDLKWLGHCVVTNINQDWTESAMTTLYKQTQDKRRTRERLLSLSPLFSPLRNHYIYLISFQCECWTKFPPVVVLSVTIRLKCFNLNVENNKNNFLTRGFTGSELNQLNIQIFSSVLLGYKLFTISTFSFSWKYFNFSFLTLLGNKSWSKNFHKTSIIRGRG